MSEMICCNFRHVAGLVSRRSPQIAGEIRYPIVSSAGMPGQLVEDDGSVKRSTGIVTPCHRSLSRPAGTKFLMPVEDVILSAHLSSISLTNVEQQGNYTSVPFRREVRDAILAFDGSQAERPMKKFL
jgi:hypothetical protein